MSEERPKFRYCQAQKWLPKLPLGEEKHLELVNTFEEYHELGIMEKSFTPSGSFLPYHLVHSARKSRVVYNASARPWHGLTLNELLWSGPNLLENLMGILVRFRIHRFPVMADIQKAFLMVAIRQEDREFLKVLWQRPDGSQQISRFARVPFGLTCGPYLLLITLQVHLRNEMQKAGGASALIKKLQGDVFMDDVTSGFDNLEEALRFKTEAEVLLGKAGMKLQKFHSRPQVMEHWGLERSPDSLKVLGLGWNPSEDNLQIELRFKAAETKREVASSVAAVFDPLSLAAPFLIRGRILLQSLWKRESGWDEPLEEEDLQEWRTLRQEAETQDVRLYTPRHIIVDESSEFAVFCDASSKAYAACIFVKNGSEMTLLIAKARVAPLKQDRLTIPKLELMAALLAVRLREVTAKLLDRDLPTSYFSDSKVTLGWIQGSPKEVFVRNRVRNILLNSSKEQWNHIEGEDNPADLATRGMSPRNLQASRLWWHGPQRHPATLSMVAKNPAEPQTEAESLDPDPLGFDNFSSWKKLVAVVSVIMRWRKRSRDRDPVAVILRYLQMRTPEWSVSYTHLTLPTKA